MDVVPVLSRDDFSRFIRLPHQIYRDDKHWVAPLTSDERARLTPGKNPYFEHAEAAYFLARDRGRDVGRIAASVDRNYDAYHGERQATFGFLEAESPDATAALLGAAEGWSREHGASILRGPMNFTTNDDCGLLIRGFEEPATILMPYNPPSYPAWVESAGLRKSKDLFAFKVPIPASPEKEIAQVARIAQKARDRYRVRVRSMNMKRFGEELQRVKEIYNSAWEKNWGFVPMTEHEIDHMAAQLKPTIVPELALFAEIDGEPVGFALAIPDVNIALKPLRGSLYPFGIVRLLWSLRKIRTLRLMALGVKAGFRRRGIDASLVHQAAVAARAKGYVWCEVGWTLEDNDLINRLIEAVNGEQYKTYRIYERTLA